MNRDGYQLIGGIVGTYEAEHRIVWRERFPKACMSTTGDGDKLNNVIDNLELIDAVTHRNACIVDMLLFMEFGTSLVVNALKCCLMKRSTKNGAKTGPEVDMT